MTTTTRNGTWTFQGAAWNYERNIAPILAQWTDELLDEARIAPGMRVLDLACGTGSVARRAAARVDIEGSVVGVDISPEMLEAAQVLAQQNQMDIEWRNTPADALPFADAAFDMVTCQQGLQFFPDRAAALAEMARVLRPGGRVALLVWRSLRFQPGLAKMLDTFAQYVGLEATTGARAPFGLGDASELRRLLTNAGFDDIRITIAVRGARTSSVDEEIETMADFLADAWSNLGAQAQAACKAEIAAALAEYVDDDGYLTPMEAHLIIAEST